MKRSIFLLISICLLVTSCVNKSEQEIQSDTESGVVLVQNKSYYEVVLSNGESIYFSGFDENGDARDLKFDKDSVKAQSSFGTGFLVSKDGQIVTNAHVVSNMVADKDVNRSVAKIMEAIKELIRYSYNESRQQLQQAVMAYNYANRSSQVSYDDFYQVQQIKEALEERVNELVELYNQIDEINASDSKIKYHNEVSVAYNNTFVTDSKDFIPCIISKTDAEHDLAVIQLKDKKTPEDKYVFEIPEEDPLETYTAMDKVTSKISDDKNSRLFMTSFNLGPTLAITKEGIKSQFNSGAVSQKTSERLMYSIPTLPGSSGSPVINREEELIAINYAGINGTQNFNYGIRVKYLKELMNR